MSIPSVPPSLQEVLHTPPSQLPRNRATEASHKREVWWQVYFPLLIGSAVALGLVGMTFMAWGGGNTAAIRIWSDVSLIFVILLMMVVIFPLLVIFFGLWYGLGYLIQVAPPYFKIAQDYTIITHRKVEKLMQWVVWPVLQARAGAASVDRAVQSTRRFFRR